MWLIKIACILLMLVLFKGQMQTCHDTSYVKMEIRTSKNKITQSEKILPLIVEIENKSSREISILPLPDFSTDSSSVFQLIVERNGKKRISPEGLLKKKRIPKASDYKNLKQGEKLLIKCNLDLSSLVDEYKYLGQKNLDFGKYNIQVLFRDHFMIKSKAVKYLQSNIIEIEYIL